jgi:putative protease
MNDTPSNAFKTDPKAAKRPEILAPAGGRDAFLAALAAGADAVYCGLKRFSARMAAENFTIEELIPLTRLAHNKGVFVYVALNSLVKPDEIDAAEMILSQLSRKVKPDALIIQDLGLVALARQAGFNGEIHLSTLANAGFAEALKVVERFPEITRVVLPRELSIDEIRLLSDNCPDRLSLEVFIHGALCYAVSGRCYWSSFMGGKSGLRGRCVQPCRRIYRQQDRQQRFFSCQDLGVDVLTKILPEIPKIAALKIEGRKKGPHYVYYTVAAYRLLRDHPGDAKAKKTAMGFLEYALGRKTTHYNLLSQRPQNPVDIDIHTGSGLMIGRISGKGFRPGLSAREELLPGDMLRVGYEDEPWHTVSRIKQYIPRKGRVNLKLPGKTPAPAGTPVFLIDRRDAELARQMADLAAELISAEGPSVETSGRSGNALPEKKPTTYRITSSVRAVPAGPVTDITVWRRAGQMRGRSADSARLWLMPESRDRISSDSSRLWYWLPPVIWPDNEAAMREAIRDAVKHRCTHFVANAPWQIGFFEKNRHIDVWAGPFCNTANPAAISLLKQMGFSGAIVSPELAASDYALLPAQSPLPLGIVTAGNWPLCVSRTKADSLETDTPFASPRGEEAWAAIHGPDVWVFPNWEIDLSPYKTKLQSYGYRLFVRLAEPVPRHVTIKKRPGLWNWEMGLQ